MKISLVVAILLTCPMISKSCVRIILKDWNNQLEDVVNVYHIENPLVSESFLENTPAEPLAQIMPGINQINMVIPVKENREKVQFRFVAPSNPQHCLELILWRHAQTGIEVASFGKSVSRYTGSSKNLFHIAVNNFSNTPLPIYRRVAIDGTIPASVISDTALEFGFDNPEKLR